MSQANYRATPGAWLVFQLYGKQHSAPYAAYWWADVPDRLSLTPGGARVTTY